MKKAPPKKGDAVEWNFGKGKGHGKVTQVHSHDVEKTIKGAAVKRKASPEKPAFEIKTDKGQKVLKSITEVKRK